MLIEDIIRKANFLSASKKLWLKREFNNLPLLNQTLIFVISEYYSNTQNEIRNLLSRIKTIKNKFVDSVRKEVESLVQKNKEQSILLKINNIPNKRNIGLRFIKDDFYPSFWREKRLVFMSFIESQPKEDLVNEIVKKEKREVVKDGDLSEVLKNEIEGIDNWLENFFNDLEKAGEGDDNFLKELAKLKEQKIQEFKAVIQKEVQGLDETPEVSYLELSKIIERLLLIKNNVDIELLPPNLFKNSDNFKTTLNASSGNKPFQEELIKNSVSDFVDALEDASSTDKIKDIIFTIRGIELIKRSDRAFAFALKYAPGDRNKEMVLIYGSELIKNNGKAFASALKYAPSSRKEELIFKHGSELIKKSEIAFVAALEYVDVNRREEFIFTHGSELMKKSELAFISALMYVSGDRNKEMVLIYGSELIKNNVSAFVNVLKYVPENMREKIIINGVKLIEKNGIAFAAALNYVTESRILGLISFYNELTKTDPHAFAAALDYIPADKIEEFIFIRGAELIRKSEIAFVAALEYVPSHRKEYLINVIKNSGLKFKDRDIFYRILEYAPKNKIDQLIFINGSELIKRDGAAFAIALKYAPENRKEELIFKYGIELVKRDGTAFVYALENYCPPLRREELIFKYGIELVKRDGTAFATALRYAPENRREELIFKHGIELVKRDGTAFAAALKYVPKSRKEELILMCGKLINKDGAVFVAVLEHISKDKKEEFIFKNGIELVKRDEVAFATALEHAPENRKGELIDMIKNSDLKFNSSIAFDKALSYAPKNKIEQLIFTHGDYLIRYNKYAFTSALKYAPQKKEQISAISHELIEDNFNEKTLEYENVSFSTNVLTVAGEKYSVENQIKIAKEWLHEKQSLRFRKKAVLLLIANGETINNLSKKDIVFCAETLEDTGRTKISIKELSSNEKCFNLARKYEIPLSSYLSILIATNQQIPDRLSSSVKKSFQENLFKAIIEFRETKIKNQPMLAGVSFLPIIHEKGDSPYSYYNQQESFSTEPLTIIAEKLGLKVPKILQYETGKTTVTQFSTYIKSLTNPTSILFAGHGNSAENDGIISLSHEGGDSAFSMKELFNVIAENPKNVAQILFESCYSDMNIKRFFLKEWDKNDKTKGLPTSAFLSASNSNSPSGKMSLDAWYYFAKFIVPKLPKGHPTWGDFWKQLEGRLMIIGDGEMISDPAVSWPIKKSPEIMKIIQDMNRHVMEDKNKLPTGSLIIGNNQNNKQKKESENYT